MPRRRSAALLATLVTALLLLPGPAASASVHAAEVHTAEVHTAATDFSGIVALDDCSGALIRPATAAYTDPALVLSNGHCLETGMPGPGQVVVAQPSHRTFTLLDSSGQESLGTLTATSIAYGTMTDTDVALYRLAESYADIERRYHIRALSLATAHPARGEAITIASGYWRQTYSCAVDAFVYQLKEASWTWRDAIRYTTPCAPPHGTSGSPIIDDRTRQVVGVNNTGNDSGQRCTLNNPCEVDEHGGVVVRQGRDYGEETVAINGCLGAGNTIDLTRRTCALPR